jgi:hypothetical protein
LGTVARSATTGTDLSIGVVVAHRTLMLKEVPFNNFNFKGIFGRITALNEGGITYKSRCLCYRAR